MGYKHFTQEEFKPNGKANKNHLIHRHEKLGNNDDRIKTRRSAHKHPQTTTIIHNHPQSSRVLTNVHIHPHNEALWVVDCGNSKRVCKAKPKTRTHWRQAEKNKERFNSHKQTNPHNAQRSKTLVQTVQLSLIVQFAQNSPIDKWNKMNYWKELPRPAVTKNREARIELLLQ